jgi:hypothetical protein
MSKQIRRFAFVCALLAVAAVASATPANGYERTYYDQYGNTVGMKALYCNGVRFQDGEITAIYTTDTWSCADGGP